MTLQFHERNKDWIGTRFSSKNQQFFHFEFLDYNMCLYVVIFMHLYAICVLPVGIALPYQTSIFLSCFVVVNKENFFYCCLYPKLCCYWSCLLVKRWNLILRITHRFLKYVLLYLITESVLCFHTAVGHKPNKNQFTVQSKQRGRSYRQESVSIPRRTSFHNVCLFFGSSYLINI